MNDDASMQVKINYAMNDLVQPLPPIPGRGAGGGRGRPGGPGRNKEARNEGPSAGP